MIHIEMFPAKAGDSFLLSFEKTHLLIDTGFTKTYDHFIKPRLQTLQSCGEVLTLLLITHIDEDHIQGALKLLKDNGLAYEPALIPIRQIWHNAFKHLPIPKTDGVLSPKGKRKLETITGPITEVAVGSPISAKQGSVFAKNILKGGYAWNADFDGKAVSTDIKKNIQLTPFIQITLLSPTNEQLEQLVQSWKLALYNLGFREPITADTIFDDALELLLRELPDSESLTIGKKISTTTLDVSKLKDHKYAKDNSARNGSSIAFILEIEEKRLLFLADAHSEVIMQQLEPLFRDEPRPIYFDFIKVAHHGSFNNNKPDLWSNIDSDCYAISTDGKDHEHPSLETLAWIVDRPVDKLPQKKRHLYFNYPTNASQAFDDEAFKTKFKYELHITTNNQSTLISI